MVYVYESRLFVFLVKKKERNSIRCTTALQYRAFRLIISIELYIPTYILLNTITFFTLLLFSHCIEECDFIKYIREVTNDEPLLDQQNILGIVMKLELGYSKSRVWVYVFKFRTGLTLS